jgi:hypothetical protein
MFLGGASMDTQKIAYQEIEALHLPEGVLIGMEFGFGEIKKEPKEVDEVRCTFFITDTKYGTTMQEVMDNIPASNADVIDYCKDICLKKVRALFQMFQLL